LSEPIRAEWASGRRKFSLALLLLWFGGAWLAISVVIGLQILAVPRMAADLGRSSFFFIPSWAVIALILALSLRRKPASRAISIVAISWLLIGVIGLIWFAGAHA